MIVLRQDSDNPSRVSFAYCSKALLEPRSYGANYRTACGYGLQCMLASLEARPRVLGSASDNAFIAEHRTLVGGWTKGGGGTEG
jgi:hypothetical protein